MIELVEKDIKPSIKILHIFKKIEENRSIMRTETEDILKTQIQLLEIKYTMPDLKKKTTRTTQNTVDEVNSRLYTIEKNIVTLKT